MRNQLFIDGTWHEGSDGERFTVLDPATGDAIAEVAAGTPAERQLLER